MLQCSGLQPHLQQYMSSAAVSWLLKSNQKMFNVFSLLKCSVECMCNANGIYLHTLCDPTFPHSISIRTSMHFNYLCPRLTVCRNYIETTLKTPQFCYYDLPRISPAPNSSAWIFTENIKTMCVMLSFYLCMYCRVLSVRSNAWFWPSDVRLRRNKTKIPNSPNQAISIAPYLC